MAGQLTPEAIVALHVLKEKGQSNRQVARTLQVSEASVRYHLRRQGRPDGRQNKPRKAEAVAEAIDLWLRTQQGREVLGGALARPANVKGLYEWLQTEHGYQGSYKSVLRFVRAKYPRPRLRPFRRVETPPGAQAQVDWGEFSDLNLGNGPQKLYAFVMVLSHSRKAVLVWSPRMDQLSWHHAHNEALRRLGGVPAVLRIDNLKTGVAQGAGPWGEVNPAYQAYARAVGFHVDACLPRCPEHKGKVESKVRFVRRRLRLAGCFHDLTDLQKQTDEQLLASDGRRPCPVTGQSVQQSFEAEQQLLRPLPLLPEPFDLALTRTVQRDCTVHFEGRCYNCQGTSIHSQLGDTNCYAGDPQLQTAWSPELASLPPSCRGRRSLRPHPSPATARRSRLASYSACATLPCRAKRRRALLASNPTEG
jgi:transposase